VIWLFIALVAASVMLFLVYSTEVRRDIRRTRCESSRFPLFAARDRLVMLIAEGKMREDDLAWSELYESVNTLLGMHKKLHMTYYGSASRDWPRGWDTSSPSQGGGVLSPDEPSNLATELHQRGSGEP